MIQHETGTREANGVTALRASDWLSLCATPTFAIMAIMAWTHDGSMPGMLCAAMGTGFAPSGMSLMYALMSAFHLGPWLKLFSRRGTAPQQTSYAELFHRP